MLQVNPTKDEVQVEMMQLFLKGMDADLYEAQFERELASLVVEDLDQNKVNMSHLTEKKM